MSEHNLVSLQLLFTLGAASPTLPHRYLGADRVSGRDRSQKGKDRSPCQDKMEAYYNLV